LPGGIEPVPQGISFDGNIAITHEQGVFNLQDVGVYGDPGGIRCAAASAADCDDGTQNSFSTTRTSTRTPSTSARRPGTR
jgi:hypothetical protein